jgi:hypothetical protein
MIMRLFLFRIVALFLMVATASGESIAGVVHLLHEVHFGDCNIQVSHDAIAGGSGTLVIRAFDGDHNRCAIAKSQVAGVLKAALKQLQARDDLAGIHDIFLGRLVYQFAWISNYLKVTAANDKTWNVRVGKPANMNINRYVNAVLYSRELLEPFSNVLHQYGFSISGVSCEKILVNKDKLPYDGMCWLVIKEISGK